MPKIVTIRLVNCQSHADTLYHMAPGLNVIVATNNTGKSVLFKMLKVAINPEFYVGKKLRKLIRDYTQYAVVLFTFDDGSAGMATVHPKGETSAYVLYYYSEDGKTFSAPTTQPPARLLQNLSIIADNSTKFFGNIIDLQRNMLFVDSASQANFDFVKMLTSSDAMDAALHKVEAKIEYFSSLLPQVATKATELDLKKSRITYVDVDALESRINRSQEALDVYENLLILAEQLSYVPVLKSYNVDFELLDISIDLADNLQKLLPAISNIRQIDDSILTLIDIAESLETSLNMLSTVKEIDLSSVDMLETLMSFDLTPLSQVKQIDYDSLNYQIDILDTMQFIYRHFFEASDAYTAQLSSKQEVIRLNSIVNSLGREVPCPIYGKVVHADGVCVPVDNRLAQ